MAYKHGGKGTRLYRIWCKMRQRCNDQNDPAFSRYGGRGIRVCMEWNDFTAFRAWALANGYADHLTIDRIENGDGYWPGNCRWATYAEQNRNYSRNRPIEHGGRKALIGDFANEAGLPADIVKNRVRRYGWTMEDALSVPVQSRQKREPWVDHGMSRSAYYRAKKAGAISFTVQHGNIDAGG